MKTKISYYPWIEFALNQGDILRIDKSHPSDHFNQNICAWFVKTKHIFVQHGNYALVLENLDYEIKQTLGKQSFLRAILYSPLNIILDIASHVHYKENSNKRTIVEHFVNQHEDAIISIFKENDQLVSIWEAKPVEHLSEYIHQNSTMTDELKTQIPSNVIYYIFRTKTFNEMFELMINTHEYKWR